MGKAPGRLHEGETVAVIDIGSNSVRLVVYEALTRAPTPLFNEKSSCGLGRDIATTGRMQQEAIERALAAIRRFRALCDTMHVRELYVIATAAARDASNGAALIAAVEAICGVPVEILSGKREARYAAYGILSSFHHPSGIVGDMGGGSLELVRIEGASLGHGVSLPLGGLALQDASRRSLKKAEKIVKKTLDSLDVLTENAPKAFYAVGGTWRALAKLHMTMRGYPLDVMHAYTIPAKECMDFCSLIARQPPEAIQDIEVVSDMRRPLLAYGALVLEQVVRQSGVHQVVMSACGVREGLLYALLDEETRRKDALVAAAEELCLLRSRSPLHAEELSHWTSLLFRRAGIDETANERRLRHVACLLADIGWRAHPDYRGEQSLNVIANAAFTGLDHAERGYLALSVFFRHAGIANEDASPRIRELVGIRLLDRARILGAAMRVAYLLSAAMPGVLPQAEPVVEGKKLILTLAGPHAALAGERLANRLKTLARMLGLEPELRLMPDTEDDSAITDGATPAEQAAKTVPWYRLWRDKGEG